MKRSFNYTGRKRITQNEISIDVARDFDGKCSFDASLNLESKSFPKDARIYLEAYHQTQWMRFDLGTVDNVKMPADRSLTEIDSNEDLKFRLRVVDETSAGGRLIGYADNIIPGDQENAHTPLLPLRFKKLDDLIFRLEFEDEKVSLVANQNVKGIENMARHDSMFHVLVMPAILREILQKLISEMQEEDWEDFPETSWQAKWLKYANTISSEAVDPERIKDDKDEQYAENWIEAVTGTFCRKNSFISILENRIGEVKNG